MKKLFLLIVILFLMSCSFKLSYDDYVSRCHKVLVDTFGNVSIIGQTMHDDNNRIKAIVFLIKKEDNSVYYVEFQKNYSFETQKDMLTWSPRIDTKIQINNDNILNVKKLFMQKMISHSSSLYKHMSIYAVKREYPEKYLEAEDYFRKIEDYVNKNISVAQSEPPSKESIQEDIDFVSDDNKSKEEIENYMNKLKEDINDGIYSQQELNDLIYEFEGIIADMKFKAGRY